MYSEPIADFDLTQFRSEEETKILSEDFNFDLLAHASSILAYIATNDLAEKLAKTNLKSVVLDDQYHQVI
jgi:hypothetical protein